MGCMKAPAAARSHLSANRVGPLLRDWRTSRGISQLDLALRSGFSARHVSFIETGRTQPSRQAVLVLAETMEVPLRDRNRLLEAAGYARVYPQTAFAAAEMEHVRGVLQFILDRHKPYPALVLDRYSNCLMGNGESSRLLREVADESLIGEHANHLRVVFHPLGARRFIVNWSEVARHLWGRTQRELGHAPDDPAAADLLAELQSYLDPAILDKPVASFSTGDLLLPIHIRKDDLELRLFSTIMTLGTPQDVTLQELRVETFFPADDLSDKVWRKLDH
jgi:transcriptional regulator with XRE-family HTH domain